MKATVTKRFYGAPDDKPSGARWFEPGETIDGQLAESAVTQGNAKEGKAKGPAPSNKAR